MALYADGIILNIEDKFKKLYLANEIFMGMVNYSFQSKIKWSLN